MSAAVSTSSSPGGHMAKDESGWVSEGSDFEAVGLRHCFRVKRLLHNENTPYQNIKIYETTDFGNLMVLDEVFQNTDADEFAYHEMMAHVPLFAHPNPTRVLVIGGGDGGIVREALKHKSVKEVHLVEIDQRVTELSRQYFDGIACALDDPRVTVKHECGNAYLSRSEWEGYYDVIICDSSDPIGPNQPLFKPEFYEKVNKALTKDGFAVFQGENMWLHPVTIKKSMEACKQVFGAVDYYNISIPVYPCGMIGFITGSKGAKSIREIAPDRREEVEELSQSLNYYSAEIHLGSFAKPRFFYKGLPKATIDKRTNAH